MVNTSDILPNTPRYLKIPLIFFNCVLWILGVVLIALGGWVLSQLKNIHSLNINVTLPSGLIVLGVFIIVLTIVGCVVAYKEQLIGLIAYTVVMLILLVCLIGVGGAAFSDRSSTDNLLNSAWKNADDGVRGTMERYFACCGWGGENDTYANATLKDDTTCFLSYTYNQTNVSADGNITFHDVTEWVPNFNATDCQSTIQDFVNERLYVAGVAGVVIGVIELVCMSFSLYLIIRLCRNPRSRSYD